MEDGNPTPGCHPGRKRMERRRRRRTRAESVTSDINSLRNVSSTGIRLSMYFIVARIIKERRVICPGRMSDLYDDYNNRRAGIIAISCDECRFNSRRKRGDVGDRRQIEYAFRISDGNCRYSRQSVRDDCFRFDPISSTNGNDDGKTRGEASRKLWGRGQCCICTLHKRLIRSLVTSHVSGNVATLA